MSTFTLDGKTIPFEKGDTIIRAAWKEGIEIPHYCWHPGLSVAANCRMCLVHIESARPMAMPILRYDAAKDAFVPDTKPKLMPACQVAAEEGMVVSSTSETVKNAQSAVQELLLLNHPVDCPICDQAGECKLQDYWLEHHRPTTKRKRTEPVHKPKAVRFGKTIVYDAERCVMCTRCIRVCDELVGDPVLDMRERGNRNEIVLAPGRELDHRYTLMTEHVCPVGALTSRDFRFKARVWFLRTAPGVCNGCATGCNTHIDYDPRYGQVYRLRPRDNMAVNRFWMCDEGMMSYRELSENRLSGGIIVRNGKSAPATSDAALKAAADALKDVPRDKIAIVLSAQRSTEDNLALADLAQKLGSTNLYLAALGDWEGDSILRSADHNPNRAGALRAAGGSIEETVEDLVADVLAGEIAAVIVLGDRAEVETDALKPLTDLKATVVLASHHGPLTVAATHVIPVASWAEQHGSYVNAQGSSQHFRRALPPAHGVRAGWEAIVLLAEQLGLDLERKTLKDLQRSAENASTGAGSSAEASP